MRGTEPAHFGRNIKMEHAKELEVELGGEREGLKRPIIIYAGSSACYFLMIYVVFYVLPYIYSHQVAVFIAFLLVPMLALRKLKRPMALGKIDIGFAYGLLAYLLLYLWVIAYYPSNPQFFDQFRLQGIDMLVANLFIAMNVMPVDFFTKRMVQYELQVLWGVKIAFVIQQMVWLLVHIPEFFWLLDLMGAAGALLFLLGSGALTGAIYARTKNVLGLMLGHWLLNLFVMLSVTM